MAVERRASATWSGDLASGSGTVDADSGVLSGTPVDWRNRAESAEDQTSPEELLAAAHAACYAMALSHALGQAGSAPERLEVTAVVTFDQVEGGFGVTSSRLTVNASVPGIDEQAFSEAANGAKDGCPISQALKNNVDISLEASLR
jgi:lipoyl-dependent peroxiredoxin